jgi:hypothetical protein
MLSWNDWLEEHVYWKEVELISRRRAIYRFVKYGLIPLLNRHGYDTSPRIYDLCSRIATGLYINQGKSYTESKWDFCRTNYDYLEDDQRRFWHVIDADTWDIFWNRWGVWSDIDLMHWRGEDRRIDIQEYTWTQINLERSVQTQIVNEYLGIWKDSGEDGVQHSREDQYIRDAKDSGEWGGYRK